MEVEQIIDNNIGVVNQIIDNNIGVVNQIIDNNASVVNQYNNEVKPSDANICRTKFFSIYQTNNKPLGSINLSRISCVNFNLTFT